MVTENLSVLKIHKLTQEQYDREREAGRLDTDALYLTPESDVAFTPEVTPYNLVQRDELGYIKVPLEPVSDNNAVSKKYVDAIIDATSTTLDELRNYIDTLTNIESISGGGYGDVPNYHFVECARILENIENFKAAHPNHLIFGAVSDIHVYNSNTTYEANTKASIRNAAFGLEMVGAMAECDFIVNLGDNCWENGIDTDNAMLGAQYSINTLQPAFDRITSFNLVGNHDKSDDTQGQYDLIGVHNDFDVHATTQIRGFGYKDFADKKVRVIVLNTCDYLNASGGCAASYEQKDFLIRALDLSTKSDCADWQILLLSHIPLDWNGGDYNFIDMGVILGCYVAGSTAEIVVKPAYALNETPSDYATYSDAKLVYDYSGKNSAKIIANIHGHVHTDAYGRMADSNILRMATPNTCFYLGKTESYPDYGDYSIDTAIARTAGTATDACAVFYCIDLDEQVIYAYAYGAGTDRVSSYKDVATHSIAYNLTNCTISNTTTNIIDNEEYSAYIYTDEGCTMTSVVITMNGIDISSSYDDSTGLITISAVDGDIVITAIAADTPWEETISDIAVAPRSVWYFNTSTSTIELQNSNTEAAIGVSTANSYAFTDRESKVIYAMPVPARASVVEIINTDGISYTYSYTLLKDNGSGVLSQVNEHIDTSTSITFTKSSADYILIEMTTTDDSNVAWGYDDSKITVKFTNGLSSDGDSNGGEGDTSTYTNLFSATDADFVDGYRFSSSGGNTSGASAFLSGYIAAANGDVIRVRCPDGNYASGTGYNYRCICTYNSSKAVISCKYPTDVTIDSDGVGFSYTITDSACAYIRVSGNPNGNYANFVVTKNEEIV